MNHLPDFSKNTRPGPTLFTGLSISREVKKRLQSPRGLKCFTELDESEAEDFSVCGDGVVEGDEECDCGLSYRS